MNKITESVLKGAQSGTKNFVLPAIDVLIAQQPEYIPAWIMVKGYFGSLLDIQQDRVNEFVDFVSNNKDVFTKDIVGTKDFQDGFVITFEQYIKQRNEEKRNIIKSIFLGFTSVKDKMNFELERMYDLLNKVSPSHIYVIKKLHKEKSMRVDLKNRNIEESNYEELKYLEYLGLVVVENKKDINVEESFHSQMNKRMNVLAKNEHKESIGDYDIDIEEEDVFNLSEFGHDFCEFIRKV